MLDPVLVSVLCRGAFTWSMDSHLTHDAGGGFLVEFEPFRLSRRGRRDGVSATAPTRVRKRFKLDQHPAQSR